MYIFELTVLGIKLAPTYYGLMYVLGFVFGYTILYKRKIIPRKDLDNLVFYVFLGIIIGGRLGYVLFYNFSYFLKDFLYIFKIWEGGMSFHGGVIGVIIAMLIFSKNYNFNFYKLADQVTLVLPIGIGLGRIGNYINKELLGYSGYEGLFAVKLNGNTFFPSSLLEFLLEGVVLFLILNIFYLKNKKIKNGQIASLFLIFYAIFRIIIEIFFRQPDFHIGYIYNYFTIGEILTLPMLIAGIFFYIKLGNNE